MSAWALAFYLTFERHVLGTPSLDRYVLTLQRGTDPVEAFRELAGEPLTEFERRFKEYLLDLRSDGTTARAPWSR